MAPPRQVCTLVCTSSPGIEAAKACSKVPLKGEGEEVQEEGEQCCIQECRGVTGGG